MDTPDKEAERAANGSRHLVRLEGDWVLENVAGQVKRLAGQVAELADHQPPLARADIDLALVTGIDACGCQLIALFLEQLKRRQVTVRPCHVPEQVRETFIQLGFAHLPAAPTPTEEAP